MPIWSRIRKVLRNAERKCETDAITRDFIDTFIDKIYVTPEDDRSLRLDIKILPDIPVIST